MVTLPLAISLAPFPTGFTGNADQYGQQLVSLMSATLKGDFLTGQQGGTAPTTNIGPWINGNAWYFWDEGSQSYLAQEEIVPGGTYDPIINRCMQVWQRQISFPALVTGNYMADRWKYNAAATGRCVAALQAADMPSSSVNPFIKSCLRITVSTAQPTLGTGEYGYITQGIEKQNATALFGQPTSIGIALRSSVLGTYCVSIRNADLSQCYVAECSIVNPNVWQTFTIANIPAFPDGVGSWGTLDTDQGYNIGICLGSGVSYQGTVNTWNAGNTFATANQINFFATVGNTLDITMVQHNAGSSVAPLTQRTFADEVRACNRYYTKSYDYSLYAGAFPSYYGPIFSAVNLTNVGGWAPFREPLRKQPVYGTTMQVYNPMTGGGSACYQLNTGTAVGIQGVVVSAKGIANLAGGNFAPAGAGYAQLATFHYIADVDY